MDDDEFRDSCFIPGQRNLYQVHYPNDIDEFNRIVGTTEGRRDLLVSLGVISYSNGDVSIIDMDNGEE